MPIREDLVADLRMLAKVPPEAADAIEELQAENERLRDALRYARERLDTLEEILTLTDWQMIDEALGEGESNA